MKLLKSLLLLVLALTCCLDSKAWAKESKESVKINTTFIATHEWQEIPEGQGIPKGLHVRINLQTGKKEAKLLDETEEEEAQPSTEDAVKVMHKDGALSLVPEPTKGSEKAKKVKHLDEALKRIGIDYAPDDGLEQRQQDYRSYEELKKSFEGMRKDFKMESEIIVQLIEEYHNITVDKTSQDEDSRLKTQTRILKSFNYLMSQYDNALLFVEQGGLESVILPSLVNQTNVGLKVEAMRVLGAMSQNNPKVQIKVFERNVGSHLTQILMSSTRTEELSAALYAFSSLLRKFPHAQQRILSTSGTQALVSVLGKECELKIKAKVATIIGDIILEKELVLSKSSATDDPLAAAQYAELNFPEWLQANSYCETMDTLVAASLYGFLEAPDILEYFIHALDNTRTLCYSLWSQSPQLRHILLTLRNRYSQSEDEYRLEIAELLKLLVSNLYEQAIKHDEF